MAKILVAGGLHSEDDTDNVRRRFAAALGRHIITRKHILLGGCRTNLDAVVAEAAAEVANHLGVNPRGVIRSWITPTTKAPAHRCGELIRSQLQDWMHLPRGFVFPEPIQEADACIIVGGWEGTHYAASWARLANKPLLPVATFGMAANDIYHDERAIFDRRYASRLSIDDFQSLNIMLIDPDDKAISDYAEQVVKLVEKIILSSTVFVIMSFSEEPHLIDAYNTFQRACAPQFTAEKVDHHLDARERIVPAIFDRIRRSAFVIAELSGARPNVYYELGYARALGKAVIQTAYKDTVLPFDVFDVPTVFWDSQAKLELELKKAIDELSRSPSRS